MSDAPFTPNAPLPPPRINRKRLWLSLLESSGVMLFLTIILALVGSGGSGGDTMFIVSCAGVCLIALSSGGLY